MGNFILKKQMKAFILLAILSISLSYINCGYSNGYTCWHNDQCTSHNCYHSPGTPHFAPGRCKALDLDIEMEAIEENFGDFSGNFMILAFILGATLGAVFVNLKFRRDFSHAKMEEDRYQLGNLSTVN